MIMTILIIMLCCWWCCWCCCCCYRLIILLLLLFTHFFREQWIFRCNIFLIQLRLHYLCSYYSNNIFCWMIKMTSFVCFENGLYFIFHKTITIITVCWKLVLIIILQILVLNVDVYFVRLDNKGWFTACPCGFPDP